MLPYFVFFLILPTLVPYSGLGFNF